MLRPVYTAWDCRFSAWVFEWCVCRCLFDIFLCMYVCVRLKNMRLFALCVCVRNCRLCGSMSMGVNMYVRVSVCVNLFIYVCVWGCALVCVYMCMSVFVRMRDLRACVRVWELFFRQYYKLKNGGSTQPAEPVPNWKTLHSNSLVSTSGPYTHAAVDNGASCKEQA